MVFSLHEPEPCSNQMFVLGKKRVTIDFPVDERENQLIGLVQKFSIQLCSSYDVYGFFRCESFERLGDGCVAFRAGNRSGAEDNVAPVGKWSAQRFEGPPAHEHRVTCGKPFESLHVCGDMPWEFAVFSNDTVFPNGRYDGKFHEEVAWNGVMPEWQLLDS